MPSSWPNTTDKSNTAGASRVSQGLSSGGTVEGDHRRRNLGQRTKVTSRLRNDCASSRYLSVTVFSRSYVRYRSTVFRGLPPSFPFALEAACFPLLRDRPPI